MNSLPVILIIQAAIDLILILIVIYVLFFKNRRSEKMLLSHRQTLEKLITDSNASAQDFKQALSEDLHTIRNLISRQEKKERELRELIRESEELLQRKERERFLFPQGRSTDQYRRVAELAERGMSKEEIGKETGMSPQEIQLVLDIRT